MDDTFCLLCKMHTVFFNSVEISWDISTELKNIMHILEGEKTIMEHIILWSVYPSTDDFD